MYLTLNPAMMTSPEHLSTIETDSFATPNVLTPTSSPRLQPPHAPEPPPA